MRRDPYVVLSAAPELDPCIALVERAMSERGEALSLVSTERYPDGLPLRLDLHPAGSRISLGEHDLSAARSVWLRDLAQPASLPEGLREDHRAACETQSTAGLSSLLGCLDAYVLDPIEALASAGHKPRIQRLATREGLDTPRTLVTNDPDAAQAFVRAQPAGAVCKLIDSGAVGLDGESFPTTQVTEDDLRRMEGLPLAPMIFQELLAKELELRVTVIAREVFVAAVPTGDVVDVRTDPSLVEAYRAYEGLPDEVIARLLRLLDRLGLDFASVDLVRTRDARWVLLEVNSTSYFDHIERVAGLPISGAVADLLLGRSPPRVRRDG